MATLFNTVKKPGGNPQSVKVTISLTWDVDVAPVVSYPDDDTFFVGPFIFHSDDDGYWSISDLIENEVLEPAGSLYKIVETSSAGDVTYFVDVPSAATPTFWVGDILASKPSWES